MTRYEVMVCLHGTEIFATADKSISNEAEFKNVIQILAHRFPANAGYAITSTRVTVEVRRARERRSRASPSSAPA